MQRWWLIVAGIAGVALAVLLVPRPDTGADIPDAQLVVNVPDLPPIREVETLPLRQNGSGDATAEGEGPGMTPMPSLEPSEAVVRPPGSMNPRAARLAERRDTAEARYAAKAMGPWTQVRRLVAIKNADEETVKFTESLVDDLRDMFRDPTTTDAASIEARQVSLIAELRQHEVHDEEIEKMLVLIEDRLVEYRTDRDTPP